MKIVNLSNDNTISIRESIKELPINRFTDFQKYLLQDAGLGSDMSSIDKHFKILDQFLAAGKIEEAQRERYNLHFNLYLAINKINTRHICFMCLVDTVNDKEVKDYSEENLVRLSTKLGEMGLTDGTVSEILEEVKKKLILS